MKLHVMGALKLKTEPEASTVQTDWVVVTEKMLVEADEPVRRWPKFCEGPSGKHYVFKYTPMFWLGPEYEFVHYSYYEEVPINAAMGTEPQ